MRIHHLDCGPMWPLGGALMDGASPGMVGRFTCHCLAIETAGEGVVLVDTGLGLRDMQHPFPRLPWWNAGLLRFDFDPERTMLRQLRALGIPAGEVRHIVMTHLDLDHAGGLADSPQARVHLMEREAKAARRREGVLGRTRYRPVQWGETTRWHAYPDRAGGHWFGFDAVTQLDNLPPEILLVPLPGHTAGTGRRRHRGSAWLAAARRGQLLQPRRGACRRGPCAARHRRLCGRHRVGPASRARQPGAAAPAAPRGGREHRRLLHARPGGVRRHDGLAGAPAGGAARRRRSRQPAQV